MTDRDEIAGFRRMKLTDVERSSYAEWRKTVGEVEAIRRVKHERDERALAAYRCGLSMRKVAEIWGLDKSVVANMLNRAERRERSSKLNAQGLRLIGAAKNGN